MRPFQFRKGRQNDRPERGRPSVPANLALAANNAAVAGACNEPNENVVVSPVPTTTTTTTTTGEEEEITPVLSYPSPASCVLDLCY